MPDKNKIKETIENILKLTPFTIEEVLLSADESGENYWCSIKTNEPHFFTSRNAEVLLALNHVIRRAIDKISLENGLQREIKLVVDVNDYQKNKIENLKSTAYMLYQRSLFFKSNIETDPLSSYDRRTIHEFLSDKADVTTESIGDEPYRRVVIKYQEKA